MALRQTVTITAEVLVATLSVHRATLFVFTPIEGDEGEREEEHSEEITTHKLILTQQLGARALENLISSHRGERRAGGE